MRIPFDKTVEVLTNTLLGRGFSGEDARSSARLFAEASRDGVPSHGLNRFRQYVEAVDRGEIDPAARPELISGVGALEQWDGNHGPGNLNARRSMQRAMELASAHGIGCVALAHTNHWMRGGAYGWQAAEAGYVGICWTNTIGNLPPWGATEPKLGNNPLILAVPCSTGHVVLDFAMSQYSYGKLASHRRAGTPLPFPGGYDLEGNLTTDAEEIEKSQRPLPIGMWKGSGLALMLDLIATLLSGGDSTHRISRRSSEQDVSQVFMAIRPPRGNENDSAPADAIIRETLDELARLTPAWDGARARYPGQRIREQRQEAVSKGVEVDEEIWQGIQAIAAG